MVPILHVNVLGSVADSEIPVVEPLHMVEEDEFVTDGIP
jgi:hypothetical protein